MQPHIEQEDITLFGDMEQAGVMAEAEVSGVMAEDLAEVAVGAVAGAVVFGALAIMDGAQDGGNKVVKSQQKGGERYART